MTKVLSVQIGPLKKTEVEEAERILRAAFSTFLGLPRPEDFMGDRQLLVPRAQAGHVTVLAARADGKLIGTNAATRWGSFAFFGPLTVLPEYWDRGVAQALLEATIKVIDRWGVRHSGLYTFAQSAKHVGLYQKFDYWPQHLTAILTRTPPAKPAPTSGPSSRETASVLLSGMKKAACSAAIKACAKLTDRISKGLDLTGEMSAAMALGVGDVVLTERRGVLDGFAICMNGTGSEGGAKVCYIKFGAVRGGNGAEERLDRLMDGCEAFAALRGATIEVGVNLARGEVFRQLRSRGYRVITQGVAMQRPNVEGFNRAKSWVLDDWR
jgi:GNAT superfamily N-acetyltransferase